MPTKNTVANYTVDQETQIRQLLTPTFESEDYEAQSEAIKELATRFEKKEQSVRAKAVRMGIYFSQAKVSTGKRGDTKNTLVQQIADALGESAEVMSSLENAAKPALQRIARFVTSD